MHIVCNGVPVNNNRYFENNTAIFSNKNGKQKLILCRKLFENCHAYFAENQMQLS